MLTYFKFLLLSVDEKRKYLDENCTELLSYTKKKAIVVVYAAEDFFVEVSCNQQQNLVTEMIAFRSLDRLNQYAEYIDLTRLIDT